MRKPFNLVIDHEAWRNKRRAATEKGVRFQGRQLKRYEFGIVTAVLGGGLYRVQVALRSDPYDQVGISDPQGVFRVGDQVTLGFLEDQAGLPIIISRGHRRVQGNIIGAVASLKYWSQSEATHLRNNCAPEACRLFTMSSPGDIIYTYSTKHGGLNDPRGRAFGLVSFREGTAGRLGVGYLRYNAGATLLEAYRVDVIESTGSGLVRTHEFSTTTASAIGNTVSDQLFLNSVNNHFWMNPRFGTETPRLRAWNDGENHQVSSLSPRPNYYVSVAFGSVLYPAFSVSYSGGTQVDDSAHNYWPLAITPLVATFVGSIQGLTRNAAEDIPTTWTVNPAILCSLGGIVSSCTGPGTGWPASPDGSTWTVAIAERALLDGTDGALAAIGYGQGQYPITTAFLSESFHNLHLGDFTLTLQLNVVELAAADGAAVWTRRITKTPQAPIILEGLLTPFESYIASPFGLGPAVGVDGVEGRVLENSLTDYIPWLSTVPTDFFPWMYPGRLSGGPTIRGTSFSWPHQRFFGPGNMRLFPWRSNNILATPASTDTSSFYTGCRDNMATITEFGYDTDLAGVPNGEGAGCSPGIQRDTAGNIYFSYFFPRGLLVRGRVLSRYVFELGGPEDGYRYDKHLPYLKWGWEARSRKYSAEGQLLWEKDLTQWHADAEWWGLSGGEYADFPEKVIGGPVGASVPVVDNEFCKVPVGDGKFVLVARETHDILGSVYRPDLVLEVWNGETGATLTSIALWGPNDVFATDRRQDSVSGDIGTTGDILLALAGERKSYGRNVRIKAAVDSAGVAWAIIYWQIASRDSAFGAYEQIYTIQAPTDGSIGGWSGVGYVYQPGAHEAPSGDDWESVVLVDGMMLWVHLAGDGAWKVYRKTLS